MSTLFEIRIDSKSTDSDTCSRQESYPESNPMEFFNQKNDGIKKEEIFETINDYQEKSEEELNFLDEFPEEESTRKSKYDNFPKENLKEFFEESEINYDDSLFIKKEIKKPFKLIKPEVDSFQRYKVALKEFIPNLGFSFPNILKYNYFNYLFPPYQKMDKNPMPSTKEIRNILFSINSINESDSIFMDKSSNGAEKYFLKKASRKRKQRKRKFDADNIRIKIKRSLFRALRMKLNKTLVKSGSKKFFDFFPNKFTSDINKERVKPILNMSLKEIFLNKNLYSFENEDGLAKYKHNANVVKSEEIKNNQAIQNILNKTFRQLYEDYINSDEFKVHEINRLKSSKKHDSDYIDRYEMIAKNLISFFSQ